MSTVEMKTADLIGPSLDWAVAQVEGVKTLMMSPRKGEPKAPFALFGSIALSIGGDDQSSYAPSTCWHCGGPLIQQFGCDLNCLAPTNAWEANCWDSAVPQPDLHICEGETPLIAACRAIVRAKLGDTVQIPAELLTHSHLRPADR